MQLVVLFSAILQKLSESEHHVAGGATIFKAAQRLRKERLYGRAKSIQNDTGKQLASYG
mgnify:CR=1 FL=1